MPRPVTMPIANDKRRRPERTEAIRILKPAISNIPRSVSATVHLNFPVENIDNRVRIMPVDRVDGSWGLIDSNDFNLFTRSFRKVFRCRGNGARRLSIVAYHHRL